ncbi:uncharacterized protein F5891DRAFT_1046590 [Suillus fuscotomentosus]|uniref:Uncharacterized protein n=1 Tax=Suillus fuscotomentosus TaxID=1912939 RepID=A0AAD4E1H2_9AGAM|nr:uncharacterized protein F5891DRAFT_1046590 [Suillus fuscotomentosus]KAG1897892.1 hypothetical protein F5891DRAFT_1046590 [Suillus fuscotomentosus]
MHWMGDEPLCGHQVPKPERYISRCWGVCCGIGELISNFTTRTKLTRTQITGILFQLPSGLGNGGLFNFVVDQTTGSSSSYQSGFNTALQLISTSIGLTVGLGISLVLVHPVQSRRRAAGMFSL